MRIFEAGRGLVGCLAEPHGDCGSWYVGRLGPVGILARDHKRAAVSCDDEILQCTDEESNMQPEAKPSTPV